MFEKIKGNKTFTKLMKRQNINLSYAMVEPSDSWYNIISTIHNSLNEMNPSGNIIIHGLSMGGGIAFHLVDKNIKNVKCFIIDAPNHSLKNFFKEAAFEFYKKNQDKIPKIQKLLFFLNVIMPTVCTNKPQCIKMQLSSLLINI